MPLLYDLDDDFQVDGRVMITFKCTDCGTLLTLVYPSKDYGDSQEEQECSCGFVWKINLELLVWDGKPLVV